MSLYHIIGVRDWAEAKRSGRYAPNSVEGFIHLSERWQILRPANLLYRGRTDLFLLVIDAGLLHADVVYEPGSHGEDELFPHLYGPLDVDAVVAVIAFPPNDDGGFSLPKEL